jgi:hypothetical protein
LFQHSLLAPEKIQRSQYSLDLGQYGGITPCQPTRIKVSVSEDCQKSWQRPAFHFQSYEGQESPDDSHPAQWKATFDVSRNPKFTKCLPNPIGVFRKRSNNYNDVLWSDQSAAEVRIPVDQKSLDFLSNKLHLLSDVSSDNDLQTSGIFGWRSFPRGKEKVPLQMAEASSFEVGRLTNALFLNGALAKQGKKTVASTGSFGEKVRPCGIHQQSSENLSNMPAEGLKDC